MDICNKVSTVRHLILVGKVVLGNLKVSCPNNAQVINLLDTIRLPKTFAQHCTVLSTTTDKCLMNYSSLFAIKSCLTFVAMLPGLLALKRSLALSVGQSESSVPVDVYYF